MNRSRRYGLAAGLIVLLGGSTILATIVWRWGHLAYGLGVAVVVAGVVWAVTLAVRGTARRIGLSAAAAVVVVAGAVVAVTGFPQSSPRWDVPDDAVGPDGWSARTGDLIIVEGTARDVETGKVVWAHEGPDARPLLVDDSLVVIGTSDGSIGVDPATGREVWRSAVTGRGIAHNGDVLVVADTASGSGAAVALDLATGAALWQQDGRPVMECDLGPADRFSPAREQSYVLLVRDEEREGSAELLDLADGRTTIADVDCSLTARIVGDVLLEANGDSLIGRVATDGKRLWSTPVEQPWQVDGGGSMVFTPTDRAEVPPVDVTAIDVTTGQSTRVAPPPGTKGLRLPTGVQRAPEVWALLDRDTGAALWNPRTGEIVEIPDAVRIGIDGVDVSSGWLALSGTTRDLTGVESDQCWALSQDGRLAGPIAGRSCDVAEGLLTVQQDVYPVS
ncbi:hypothetical protein GCM10027416_19830 [Okibacterium endophyticum]